jgi:hypothetical protein
MTLLEHMEQLSKAYPESIWPEPSQETRDWLNKEHKGLQDCIAASMGRHLIKLAIRPLIEEVHALQARIDELMLEYCPNEMTEAQLENWKAHQVLSDVDCPHPIVTQPETNLPISGLGGYDQVLRDEFEDGKK